MNIDSPLFKFLEDNKSLIKINNHPPIPEQEVAFKYKILYNDFNYYYSESLSMNNHSNSSTLASDKFRDKHEVYIAFDIIDFPEYRGYIICPNDVIIIRIYKNSLFDYQISSFKTGARLFTSSLYNNFCLSDLCFTKVNLKSFINKWQ